MGLQDCEFNLAWDFSRMKFVIDGTSVQIYIYIYILSFVFDSIEHVWCYCMLLLTGATHLT